MLCDNKYIVYMYIIVGLHWLLQCCFSPWNKEVTIRLSSNPFLPLLPSHYKHRDVERMGSYKLNHCVLDSGVVRDLIHTFIVEKCRPTNIEEVILYIYVVIRVCL